jgi:hypothetical protein
MTNCTFIGCYGADGGAASVSRAQAGEIYRATVTAVGCTFIGNYMRSAWPSSCLGGAFYLYGVDKGLIDRCEFRGNYSTNSIGVIYHRDNGYGCEEFVIRNCLFDGNKTASALAKNGTQRSGIDTGSTNFFVRSCTFVNNTSSGLYPAMKTYVVAATNRVSNCLFHNNTSDNGSQYNDVAATSAAYRNYYYNCYFSSGLISTNGCIGGGDKSDPKFTDAANGDYTLLKGSPCIDAGTYETWMADAKDLRNLKKPNRIENGIVDIGCYEYLPFVGGTMISFR